MSNKQKSGFCVYVFNSKSLLAPRKAAVKLEKEEQNEGEKKKGGETAAVSEQKDMKRLRLKCLIAKKLEFLVYSESCCIFLSF